MTYFLALLAVSAIYVIFGGKLSTCWPFDYDEGEDNWYKRK